VLTFSEKLMTYALGRALKSSDMLAVRTVARSAAKDDNRFSSIVLGIVQSAPFQQRVKAAAPATPALKVAAGETHRRTK
jgi:hypothetical protein